MVAPKTMTNQKFNRLLILELKERLDTFDDDLEVVLYENCSTCKDHYENYVDEVYKAASYNMTNTMVVVIS
jgi:hypothetical protein